jgi:hypothetical protein
MAATSGRRPAKTLRAEGASFAVTGHDATLTSVQRGPANQRDHADGTASAKAAHALAQFYRAQISHGDFTEVAEYLRSLRGKHGRVVRRALLTAAIVAYARPFIESEGKFAAARLSVSLNKVQPSAEAQRLHKLVIRLRHDALAHSADTRNKPRRLGGLDPNSVRVHQDQFDLLAQGIDVEVFLAMAVAMQKHCIQKMSKTHRLIVSSQLDPIIRAIQARVTG